MLFAFLHACTPTQLDVLSATIEYRGDDDVDDQLAEQDAEALLAFFRAREQSARF